MNKWMPIAVVTLAVAWLGMSVRPARDLPGGMAVQEFGQLPTVFNGRFQPLDSIARNSLLQLREKQSIYLPAERRYLSASEWLLEVMMLPERADDRRAFRVDHPDLIGLLKLPTKDAA
ncbi:MAG TPA: cytochrome C biogenesis protein, partial [Candidatus Dormibacteraeota bacterium]|nr:cytochrome C biogenesis protein [Candidatus Dormibacteraeota bacterium]